MEKKKLSNLDITIYKETFDNGFEIYILPQDRNNICALYTTKYGASYNEFKPVGENEIKKFPLGIAHFLEHKLFEQKNGLDPFKFYEQRGSYCNAYTSKNQTTYLFQGTGHFEENLNFLLDFVGAPFFTDKNVEKEKGIIIQEIKMYLDDPWSVLYDNVFESLLYNDYNKYPIAGTVDSIKSITKEDLYACYRTFYQPCNMFLVVGGRVDPKGIIKIVKDKMREKEVTKKIEIKQIREPEEVVDGKKIIYFPVNTPKISINYKIPILKKIEKIKQKKYLNLYLYALIGPFSKFHEQLQKKGIINGGIKVNIKEINDYFLLMISADVNEEEKFIKIIKQEIELLTIEEEIFNIIKKTIISSFIYDCESVESLVNNFTSQIVQYGDIIYDIFDKEQELNYNDCLKIINKFNFKNNNYVIVKPKE